MEGRITYDDVERQFGHQAVDVSGVCEALKTYIRADSSPQWLVFVRSCDLQTLAHQRQAYQYILPYRAGERRSLLQWLYENAMNYPEIRDSLLMEAEIKHPHTKNPIVRSPIFSVTVIAFLLRVSVSAWAGNRLLTLACCALAYRSLSSCTSRRWHATAYTWVCLFRVCPSAGEWDLAAIGTSFWRSRAQASNRSVF